MARIVLIRSAVSTTLYSIGAEYDVTRYIVGCKDSSADLSNTRELLAVERTAMSEFGVEVERILEPALLRFEIDMDETKAL